MAHLLVTGGAGYIGSHTVHALRRAGHGVVVVDDLRAGHPRFLEGVPLCRHDAGNRERMHEVFARYGPFDGVVHFAASISVGESMRQPLAYWRNNAVGSFHLVETALEHGVRAFVLSSTAAVYGHPEFQPISEAAPIAPINPYGASKAAVEYMLADVERAHGMRWIALRYFNACGADPGGGLGECHEPETHLIPVALEAAAGLRPELVVYGVDYPTRDGTCIRDYVHVTDLADAHVRAVEGLLADSPGGPYNLGTGHGRSVREILDAVPHATGRSVPWRTGPRREGDPPELVADVSRFRRDFGWEPARSDLDTILRTAWAWLASWKGVA
ncbi:MAG TPA: UDP-glucose 4-epimerase GalE [Myxococcota bacterium]|nr:UDP-glucose 4-epimerase GalE [Myxococcota bacterium]